MNEFVTLSQSIATMLPVSNGQFRDGGGCDCQDDHRPFSRQKAHPSVCRTFHSQKVFPISIISGVYLLIAIILCFGTTSAVIEERGKCCVYLVSYFTFSSYAVVIN